MRKSDHMLAICSSKTEGLTIRGHSQIKGEMPINWLSTFGDVETNSNTTRKKEHTKGSHGKRITKSPNLRWLKEKNGKTKQKNQWREDCQNCSYQLSFVTRLSVAGTTGYLIGRMQNTTSETSDDKEPVADVDENSGVAIISKYYAASQSGDAYGSFEITYTVTPVIYTAEIKASL